MKQNAFDYSYEVKLHRRTRIARNVIGFLCIYTLVNMCLHVGIFSVFVRSDTMGSSLPKNSAVFVKPVNKSFERGDIIYIMPKERVELSRPQKWFRSTILFMTLQELDPYAVSQHVTEKPCLRRVIAKEGDTVYMKDYVAYVKPYGGSTFLPEFDLSESKYSIESSVPVGIGNFTGIGATPNMDEVTLEAGQYFVLADRRMDSVDSRMWGCINPSMIGGKAVFQYFPFSRYGRL